MIKKQYTALALFMGVALLGGSTAYAFGPGGFTLPASALTNFSAQEQSAITQAGEIRQKAEEQAQAVLDQAGVTKEELHTAMKSFRTGQREAMDSALDANDYTAFKAVMESGKMSEKADALTPTIFAKLVEIRTLEKSGDKQGAMELRKELKDEGFPFGGHMGKGGHKGMMGEHDDDAR